MRRVRGCIDSLEGINCCNSGGTLAGNFGTCAFGMPPGSKSAQPEQAWACQRRPATPAIVELDQRKRRKISVLADCHFRAAHLSDHSILAMLYPSTGSLVVRYFLKL